MFQNNDKGENENLADFEDYSGKNCPRGGKSSKKDEDAEQRFVQMRQKNSVFGKNNAARGNVDI